MYYRPRMKAVLHVPTWGTPLDRKNQANDDSITRIEIDVHKATHVRNNFQQADELDITIDWRDAGIDPRLLESAIVEFYLGNADDDDNWTAGGTVQKDRRFIGVATEIERQASEDQKYVTIKALDYTTLLIESKPYPAEGLPTYSMDLQEAWKLICDKAGGKDTKGNWFKSCEFLADKLVNQGVSPWPPKLDSTVSKRLSKGSIDIKKKSDAWAVWQHCVGMLGLISWIDQEQVIVSTATNYYTSKAQPVFVYGKNILSIRERRVCTFSGKKIAVLSYNPLTGQTIQALWPSPDKAVKKKMRAMAGNKIDAGLVSQYEVFELNGVTDEDALMAAAKRIYEEHSRQELVGTLVTSEMLVDRNTSETRLFDLLNLSAGDDIIVKLDSDVLEGLAKTDDVRTVAERTAWLTARGYPSDIANLLAKNQKALELFTDQFNVKTVTTTMETDSDGGSFQIEIEFCNRMDIGAIDVS